MNTKKDVAIVVCLMAFLVFTPLVSFAQAANSFSGEGVALQANALGISLSAADTEPFPLQVGI